jgi:hypothetical protein
VQPTPDRLLPREDSLGQAGLLEYLTHDRAPSLQSAASMRFSRLTRRGSGYVD